MISTLRILILAVAALLQAGCGYLAQTVHDKDYSELGVGNKRGALGVNAENTNRCTTSFLIKNWGEPDSRVNIDHNQTILSYYVGLKWVGASPVVLIPLPLFIPVGREVVSFTLKEENIVAIRHETARRAFFYFPLVIRNDITVGIANYGPPGTKEDCLFKKES